MLPYGTPRHPPASLHPASTNSVDSQIGLLQASGADTFFDISIPKFAAQAIRKLWDVDWKPLHVLTFVSTSVGGTLKPAGLDRSVGIVSVGILKDPTDRKWDRDAGMKEWRAWMDKYYPEGDRSDGANIYGYLIAQTLMQVLRQCGTICRARTSCTKAPICTIWNSRCCCLVFASTPARRIIVRSSRCSLFVSTDATGTCSAIFSRDEQ
jgi:hypothetical protein